MHDRIRGIGAVLALLGAALAVAGLAACGSDSSGQAQSLLKQTFSGPHKVQSGNLTVNLTMTPSGSTTLTGPVSLSFGGPFQSRGTGATRADADPRPATRATGGGVSATASSQGSLRTTTR